jgi:hypothetical protein
MSQIIKPLPGKHEDGVFWADGDMDTYDDMAEGELHVDEDGNYVPKSVKKSVRLYSGLIHNDDLLKAMSDENEDEDDQGEEEEVEADLEEKVTKSFFSFVEDNPVIVEGINNSPFLYEMVKSLGLTFLSLEDRVGASLHQVDSDFTEFAKSLDFVFDDLGKSISTINGTAGQMDMHKSIDGADTDEVQYLEKSGFEPEQTMSREDVLSRLVKGVEEGKIPPLAVMKYEHTGFLGPDIQKSIGL